MNNIYSYEEALQSSLQYFNGDELAASVFLSKYALRNENEELVEKNPDEMHKRLAKEFARIEKKYPNPMSEEEVYGLFKNFEKIVPQGSPMSAIGNNYKIQSASNCFVLSSPLDSYSGILKTDQEQAQIMKRRGGVGFDISYIRPKGLPTNNSAKTTDGIGIFMERFSNTCREVAQLGRRGALMISISVHHPEIETFINIKRDLKKVTGANISIRLSDEFMKAVKEDGYYEQKWKHNLANEDLADIKDPTISIKVKAKDIWNQIIESAWTSAEPGLLFWDTAKKYTPADIYKTFGYGSISTNPCLTGDALVAVADGRGDVPIKQLAEEGKDVPVYCYDDKMNLKIRTMRNPRLTGENQKVYTLTLENNHKIKATENHKFLLTDGQYKQVKDLTAGDSIKILTKYKAPVVNEEKGKTSKKKYLWFNNKTPKAEHRIIAEHFHKKIEAGEVVHHKDYNTQNNSPHNLEIMNKKAHDELHSKDMIGDKNPMRRAKYEWSKEKLEEYSKNMSLATTGSLNGNAYKNVSNEEIKSHAIQLTLSKGRKFSSGDWLEYAEKNKLPKVFTDYREKELGTLSDLAIKCAEICGFNTELDPRMSDTILNMEKQGYETKVIDNTVCVKKSCAHCNSEYYISYNQRESATCSNSCSNYYLNKTTDTNIRRTNSIHAAYSSKMEKNKIQQLRVYTGLKFKLQRDPFLKEWEEGCKENKLSYRLKTKFGFESYKELKKEAANFNHIVVSVEFAGYENVYNGTVDEFHNFFVGSFKEKDKSNDYKSLYINNLNCGEIILSAEDSCRLMVVNLLHFVKNPYTKEAFFDLKEFNDISEKAQRLMDDMIDIELELVDGIINKINKDPEPEDVKKIELDLWNRIKTACSNGRRTGLGITALGDALAALNIRYGSKESITKTEEIYKHLAIASYRSSCVMAGERGAFPVFSHELEKGHPYLERIWEAAPDVYKLYKKHGRRNIANTTTAPTGSVSVLTKTTSGIEPAYLVSYKRRKKINVNEKDAKVDFVDQMGDKWTEFTVYHHGYKSWMDISGKDKYEDSPYYKSTSADVDWEASVELQSVAQKWICHAISKTCNLPNDATKELVSNVYMKAWESGCKGFTVYRDGCRTGVLVSNDEKKETKLINKTNAPKRPEKLPCDIYHIKAKGDSYFVAVGLLDKDPYEVFAGKNGFISKDVKKGFIIKRGRGKYDIELDTGEILSNISDHIEDNEEALTRMLSISLRHGADINFIVTQLEKTKGDMTAFGKAVSRALKKYIPDGTEVKGEKCEKEGCEGVLVRSEGCMTCKTCGFSKCG